MSYIKYGAILGVLFLVAASASAQVSVGVGVSNDDGYFNYSYNDNDSGYASLPKDPQVKVQIYNAEIAPGGYTNWHRHNGTTFFIALQGIFEAQSSEGASSKQDASRAMARF